MAVSFDLFETLVTAEKPEDPAAAVARALAARGVAVPDDWETRYARAHVDAPEGVEVALDEHVCAALLSAAESTQSEAAIDREGVREAVVAAFDPVVETRPDAREAVDAVRERGHRVAICSNCSVPGLVERTLARSRLEAEQFDAVVTSVDCGWRKPAAEIFLETAERLSVDPSALVHVGDDPRTDGGVERVGGTAIGLWETPLADLPARLDPEASDR
ncbi:HAD family hydrolase [Natronoglomus mannanivorans]|uniref:HAD family hydrolase n=1 Tax=Natronoglomus mannanivorans TaxID=2979990 RepID=A0AAP2Z079_9EURY|nr:HAD family hydrolase [Halobacteria archaeon AArc-xg1-1]